MLLDVAPYLLAEGHVLANRARDDGIIGLHVRCHNCKEWVATGRKVRYQHLWVVFVLLVSHVLISPPLSKTNYDNWYCGCFFSIIRTWTRNSISVFPWFLAFMFVWNGLQYEKVQVTSRAASRATSIARHGFQTTHSHLQPLHQTCQLCHSWGETTHQLRGFIGHCLLTNKVSLAVIDNQVGLTAELVTGTFSPTILGAHLKFKMHL